MKYVLYNPLSNNGHGLKDAREIEGKVDGEFIFCDVTQIDIRKFYTGLHSSDEVILCGGDGTINRFVNEIYDMKSEIKIWYFRSGCGNDFARDVCKKKGSMILLNTYISSLPIVKVKGRTLRFLNNVGYGVDGYCCEKGDELKAASDKKINYSLIALRGVFFDYKPSGGRVCVDGEWNEYTHVLMAPVMNGRYYGGGIKIAPRQDRLNADRSVTVVIVHNLSKIMVPFIFPLIYCGRHTLFKNVVTTMTGHNIKVQFDRPAPLQIDGETISGVTEYEVISYAS